jgi:DNA-binding transcriptional LysR family regulator
VEIRELEAFVAVATELHFGRAADKLHIGQPTLSELVRRLEREMGTPLLARTTRRVALTSAGTELLRRASTILDEVRSATAAVHALADGDVGTVRLGVTPPVASILAPHLAAALQAEAPDIELVVRRMWLDDLEHALTEDAIDVAVSCTPAPGPAGLFSHVFCGEPWLVGLRPEHPLADSDAVALTDLAGETLGAHSELLFPAWAGLQRQALRTAGIMPRIVELSDTDLSASRWLSQDDIDWILATASVAGPFMTSPLRPVTPPLWVPYMVHWIPGRAPNAAVGRFVRTALAADVPAGWIALSERHDRRTLTVDDFDAQAN